MNPAGFLDLPRRARQFSVILRAIHTQQHTDDTSMFGRIRTFFDAFLLKRINQSLVRKANFTRKVSSSVEAAEHMNITNSVSNYWHGVEHYGLEYLYSGQKAADRNEIPIERNVGVDSRLHKQGTPASSTGADNIRVEEKIRERSVASEQFKCNYATAATKSIQFSYQPSSMGRIYAPSFLSFDAALQTRMESICNFLRTHEHEFLRNAYMKYIKFDPQLGYIITDKTMEQIRASTTDELLRSHALVCFCEHTLPCALHVDNTC